MQQRTLEQQIAEAEAKLARLRNQSRQLENGQKIILGGMLLAAYDLHVSLREPLASPVRGDCCPCDPARSRSFADRPLRRTAAGKRRSAA